LASDVVAACVLVAQGGLGGCRSGVRAVFALVLFTPPLQIMQLALLQCGRTAPYKFAVWIIFPLKKKKRLNAFSLDNRVRRAVPRGNALNPTLSVIR
jgi:hypothetical protein